MRLHIADLDKCFEQTVLNHIQLDMASGQIACLIGPSGCGKTTLLRCIAGFETIDSGTIRFADHIVSTSQHSIPPEQREIGMVFQDHSLFPHLSIAQNIAFGLHRWSVSKRDQRVVEVLDLVGLSDFSARFPHQLSGGQQQRAVLARALAYRPHLLLMDEPFSSLDQETRQSLSVEVRDILKRDSTTTLWVTHDQTEAMQVGDMVGVMREGQLLQWDEPSCVYHRPATRFVADFVGECTFVNGVVQGAHVQTCLGSLRINDHAMTFGDGCKVSVMTRPGYLRETRAGIEANIRSRVFCGDSILYDVHIGADRLLVRLSSSSPKEPGDYIKLNWIDDVSAMIFPRK